MILPKTIGWDLYLSNLKSLKGVVLPEKCDNVIYKDKWYPLEEIKIIQQQEERQYTNINPENSSNSKTRGFINNILIITITILFITIFSIFSIFIVK